MPDITIAETSISPGRRQRVEIPVAKLPTETWMSILVDVVHGASPGPCLWLSAAIHGDELNGVEIIRRVLEQVTPEELHGCLIAVPIVNVFGFIEQERYLPDRRDLNRSFPGSSTRFAGGTAREPFYDGGRQSLFVRHRPAYRFQPPRQSAADSREPHRSGNATLCGSVRGTGDDPCPDTRRIAATCGDRQGHPRSAV